MMSRMQMIACCLAVSGSAFAGWEYLDNGEVRIGIDRSRGACIGWFGESETKRNLLNHWDEGRFIQQSYYGAPDGSKWNKKDWVYNPVQGGSWDGKRSKVLTFKKDKNKTSLYAKIEPLSWSGGQTCPEAIMEQTISLNGRVAHIRFKLTYTGKDQGKPRHQEMPAVFVDAVLSNLVYVSEGELTRRVPGWPNESGKTSRHWTAWLDRNDWGIGIFTPGTPEFTCYRFAGNGSTGSGGSACSYIAPVRTFALTKGLKVEYDVYLTIGTLDEIKNRFASMQGAGRRSLR
ncbi:hypothetical protein PDESU_00014 [Pontiella desulfatans]|uniref:Uncharacterized protein n=1 Tax=Pontiella desulfatans TaxID=2750659 RepID=A0A6C2TV52_PONDE|nr:hypothetical protein [Pontiella desulfatans]VGO11470.1 hypothetical protein PDESU_00014 [Pontiella desulfatans]